MDPLSVFLQRAWAHQLWFLLPLAATYLLAIAAHGGGCFGLLLALLTGIVGWYCDQKTLKTVPQAPEEDIEQAKTGSLIANVAIAFLAAIDTNRSSPSFSLFLIAIGLKLIVPVLYSMQHYDAFKNEVFPTIQIEGEKKEAAAAATTLATAKQQWALQDHNEKVAKEQARLAAITAAQALVLDFYTQHRALLRTVITDAMVQSRVQAAIKTTATLEDANAAAHGLLKEMHDHLKTAQDRAAEAEERERQRKQKIAELDAQIAKLRERIVSARNSPILDDDGAKAAEISGLDREIARLQQNKARILTT